MVQDAFTYSAAFCACEKAAQWRRRCSNADTMQAVVIYSTAISAFAKGRAMAPDTGFMVVETQNDVWAKRPYLQCCLQRLRDGRLQQALGFPLTVLQKEVMVRAVITYRVAISACEKALQWQQALGCPLEKKQKVDVIFGYTICNIVLR
jgi:hypothetical protein